MYEEKYVGEKYSHNDKQGLDCLGLVYSYLSDNGINIPRDDGKTINKEWYKDNPDRLLRGLKKYCKKVQISKLKQFDILAFEFDGIVRHLGVMVDNNRFIHARQDKKAAIMRLKHYKRFLHSVWRR